MKEQKSKKTSKQQLERLKMLAVAVEQTAEHIVITDKDGHIEYVNPAFENTTGYARDEVLGKTPRVLKSGKHPDEFYVAMWNEILSGKTFRANITNKKKDGTFYYADQTVTPIKDVSGEITHFVSVWKDVTEQVESRNKLKAINKSLAFEKHKFEQILNFDEKIGTINKLNDLIDFVVKQIAAILESDRCSLMLLDESTGTLCIKGAVGLDEKIIKETKLSLGHGIAGVVAKEKKLLLVKLIDTDRRVGRKNYSAYHTKSFLSVPIMLDQKLIGVVNVTEKKGEDHNVYTELDLRLLLALVRQSAVAIENARLYKELKYLTITDPLTNLYNFRYLMQSLDQEINRFHRFGHPLCFLMMDIDNFKSYNDSFGHLEGDGLLKKIGEVLHSSLREVDIICRYAGDEFVVILPETRISEAKVVAEKIRGSVESLKVKKKVTVSIGVVKAVKQMTRHDLILKADANLYHAKKKGKNSVFCQENKTKQ